MAATAANPSDLTAARRRLAELGALLSKESLLALRAERLALLKALADSGVTHAELAALSQTSKQNVKWAIHKDRRAAREASRSRPNGSARVGD